MILLDTHALVWMSTDPAKLSRAATAAIRKARQTDGVAISAITLWELAVLATNRRLGISGPVELVVREMTAPVIVLSLSTEIAVLGAGFPLDRYPKDPADRLIGATAVVAGIVLLTKDEAIRRSGLVRTVW